MSDEIKIHPHKKTVGVAVYDYTSSLFAETRIWGNPFSGPPPRTLPWLPWIWAWEIGYQQRYAVKPVAVLCLPPFGPLPRDLNPAFFLNGRGAGQHKNLKTRCAYRAGWAGQAQESTPFLGTLTVDHHILFEQYIQHTPRIVAFKIFDHLRSCLVSLSITCEQRARRS